MVLKEQILSAIAKDPSSVRDLLSEPEVLAKLSSIGVLPRILELHSPSTNSRKFDGVGETLCGIRGSRHSVVTCRRCLGKLAKTAR